MLPNLTGTPEAAFALTWKPAPGVENTTPRGELTLKKFGGKAFGEKNASGTPSQLISRRPVPNEPATFGLRLPRVAISPDDRLVASRSADETARVFEARTGREVVRL